MGPKDQKGTGWLNPDRGEGRGEGPAGLTQGRKAMTSRCPSNAVIANRPAGSGLFSYGILATAGLIFLTSGLQNGINAYVLPAAKCDFDLSSAQMGALNAFFLAGGCGYGG